MGVLDPQGELLGRKPAGINDQTMVEVVIKKTVLLAGKSLQPLGETAPSKWMWNPVFL